MPIPAIDARTTAVKKVAKGLTAMHVGVFPSVRRKGSLVARCLIRGVSVFAHSFQWLDCDARSAGSLRRVSNDHFSGLAKTIRCASSHVTANLFRLAKSENSTLKAAGNFSSSYAARVFGAENEWSFFSTTPNIIMRSCTRLGARR